VKKNNNEKTEISNSKILNLKSIFTPELLNKNATLKSKFENLDTTTDKEKVFKEIISYLKNNPAQLLLHHINTKKIKQHKRY
jgi:hypothetical protein